jgi:hypothetical protein
MPLKSMRLEQKVLNTADTIIVTSKTTKSNFQAITGKPIAVITNGYDVENVETQVLDTKFSLAHMVLFFLSNLILWEEFSGLIEGPRF